MPATWENRERFDSDGMRWSPVIIVSVLFHAALFSLLFLVPESFSIRRPARPGVVYEVQLVEMSGDRGSVSRTTTQEKPAAPAKEKAEPSVSVPAPKQAKRIAEVEREQKPLTIAKKTARKTKKTTQKREVSPSELIDRAISKIDRKVQSAKTPQPAPSPKPRENQGSHLDRALADIESRTRRQPGDGGDRTGGGGFLGTVMQVYQAEVTQWIKGNWSYPAALRAEGNPEATVLLEVQRDGTITSSRFVDRSANSVFDDSVLRAVERSNPLPPFPESYTKSHEEFEIRFTLEELEQG